MRPGRLALFYRSGGMWFVLGILWAACVFAAGLFAWALIQIDRVGEVSDTVFTIALLTSAMLAIIASSPLFWMCRRRRQALFRDLWPHRLAVCPTCWYPMMRGSGRCSECGRAITRRHAQQFWVGILSQPPHANLALSEKLVIRLATGRRTNRGWKRRHCNWFFKLKVLRGRPLFPLR